MPVTKFRGSIVGEYRPCRVQLGGWTVARVAPAAGTSDAQARIDAAVTNACRCRLCCEAIFPPRFSGSDAGAASLSFGDEPLVNMGATSVIQGPPISVPTVCPDNTRLNPVGSMAWLTAPSGPHREGC